MTPTLDHDSADAAAPAGETGETHHASSNVTGALALSALTAVAAAVAVGTLGSSSGSLGVGTLGSSKISGPVPPGPGSATASLCADAALRRSQKAAPLDMEESGHASQPPTTASPDTIVDEVKDCFGAQSRDRLRQQLEQSRARMPAKGASGSTAGISNAADSSDVLAEASVISVASLASQGSGAVSGARCSACDGFDHASSADTRCPYYHRGARLEHPDAQPGDTVPHMMQTDIAFEQTPGGEHVIIDGQRFAVGGASGHDNNCLIDTLRQKVRGIADVSWVRVQLLRQFASGPTAVTPMSYLELGAHWAAVIDLLGEDMERRGLPRVRSRQFTIICADRDFDGNGDKVGNGPILLHILRVHGNHFVPLIRVYSRG